MENCGDISSRKRRKPYIRKLCLALAMLAAVGIVWLIISVNNSMRPALASLAETRINSIATEAMNQAITESLNSGSDYDCLITSYDNGEKVYMLQADARRMNLLASECCAAAQKRIAEVGEQGVSLPLGTVSGITYLTGRGPRPRTPDKGHVHPRRQRIQRVLLHSFLLRHKPVPVQGKPKAHRKHTAYYARHIPKHKGKLRGGHSRKHNRRRGSAGIHQRREHR